MVRETVQTEHCRFIKKATDKTNATFTEHTSAAEEVVFEAKENAFPDDSLPSDDD